MLEQVKTGQDRTQARRSQGKASQDKRAPGAGVRRSLNGLGLQFEQILI